jgi:hypothetical protein
MKIRDENGEFESSDLPTGCCARGDSAMGISLQLERKFIIHPCSSAGLVIEVDGDVHDLQEEEDERREKAVSGLCHGLTDGNGLHSSSFILALRRGWSLKWMAMSTACRKRKMNGGRRC